MQLHLLITEHIKPIPDSAKISHDYGKLTAMFGGNRTETGLHCAIEIEENEMLKWLGKYDYFVKGSGVPQFESFEICHISKDVFENALKQ